MRIKTTALSDEAVFSKNKQGKRMNEWQTEDVQTSP